MGHGWKNSNIFGKIPTWSEINTGRGNQIMYQPCYCPESCPATTISCPSQSPAIPCSLLCPCPFVLSSMFLSFYMSNSHSILYPIILLFYYFIIIYPLFNMCGDGLGVRVEESEPRGHQLESLVDQFLLKSSGLWNRNMFTKIPQGGKIPSCGI